MPLTRAIGRSDILTLPARVVRENGRAYLPRHLLAFRSWRRSPRARRKGARWLKATLVQCARAAVRMKDRYLSALYRRIRARRGDKKAVLAVAAAILTAAYHMLKTGTPYRDLGPRPFEPAKRSALARNLLKRLEGLGFTVDIKQVAAHPG